jgi:trehalose 6-phosphate phosphatase
MLVQLKAALQHLHSGGHLWLFLDYEGTLVPIAPTPDDACADDGLLDLLGRLVQTPRIKVIILSGRSLSFLQTMLPVRGLILAGIYGAEIQTIDNGTILRADPATTRLTITRLKSAWSTSIEGYQGFLIEDKGFSLALHARLADGADAKFVLGRALDSARRIILPERFRVLVGDRFLEIAPAAAHKGLTVEWLLDQSGETDALPMYFGDDDWDEEAFPVVLRRGGMPIAVGIRARLKPTVRRLPNPDAVRDCLEELYRATATPKALSKQRMHDPRQVHA